MGLKIWLKDKLVDQADAKVSVFDHGLLYGDGVFEGIRCYRCEDGRSAVFRLREHVRRLYDSARINLLDIPFAPETIDEDEHGGSCHGGGLRGEGRRGRTGELAGRGGGRGGL